MTPDTSWGESLQPQVDDAPPAATIELLPNEYAGPLVIRKPVTIEGHGATIHARRGPVVTIESQNVTLRELIVEATGDGSKGGAEGGCAILVKNAEGFCSEQVEVRGVVMGLPGEEGVWEYPAVFSLGDIVLNARSPHRVNLTVTVPVECEVRSSMSELEPNPRRLAPGKTTVVLSLSHIRPDTMVWTELFLKTATVSRKILIRGHVLPSAITEPRRRAPEPPMPEPPAKDALVPSAPPRLKIKSVSPPKPPGPATITHGPAPPPLDYLAAAAVLLAMLGLAAQLVRLAGWFAAPSWLLFSCCAAAVMAGGARWRKRAGLGKPLAGVAGGLGALVLVSALFLGPNPGAYTKLVPSPVPVGSTEPVTCLALSQNGKLVARGSSDKSVKVWDVSSGRLLWTNTKHDEAVRTLAFSADGKKLASGGDDVKVVLWNAQSGELLSILRGHSDPLLSLAFSPNGKLVAGGSKDAGIRLWDVGSGQLSQTLSRHDGAVLALAFSADGSTLVSGGEDNKVIVWDTASGKPRDPPLRGFNGKVLSVAASADGQMVAAGTDAEAVAVWDAGNATPRLNPGNLDAPVRFVGFASRRLLASAGQNGVVRFIDLRTGSAKSISAAVGVAQAVALSSSGATLALGFQDGRLSLFHCE